jgi:hypothetical protein
MNKFHIPDFSKGTLEFRHSDGEMAIYGTREGLLRLADLCTQLANGPTPNGSAHLHLEDYELLTQRSLHAASLRIRWLIARRVNHPHNSMILPLFVNITGAGYPGGSFGPPVSSVR